jgi:hypothetical protein
VEELLAKTIETAISLKTALYKTATLDRSGRAQE